VSIRKRGKAWLVDVKVGSQRIRTTVRGDREAARKVEISTRQRIVADRLRPRGLEEALTKYLQEYAPRLKDENGQKNKAKQILQFIEDKTFDDVQDVASKIKSLPLKPATINRRLALLRRLCSLAFREWGWIDRPIAQKISLLTENNQRHVYLTREEVDLVASFCGPGESDAIRFAAYTGLRRSELFRVGPDNVRDGCLVLDANNKAGRPRMVPIHPDIEGIPLPLRTTDALLRSAWVSARVKAGLSHVKFHDLRHTWASWLAQAGVSLYTIGEILGHSQAQTTRRYSHLGREDLKAAVAKIGASNGAQDVSHGT
jgi:integrase